MRLCTQAGMVPAVNLLLQPTCGRLHALAGRVIKNYPRERVKITTKFGVNFGPNGEFLFDYSAAAARAAVEGSLKRLGVDYLDMFLMRGPCKGKGGLVEAMTAMKASTSWNASDVPASVQTGTGMEPHCDLVMTERLYSMHATGAGARRQGEISRAVGVRPCRCAQGARHTPNRRSRDGMAVVLEHAHVRYQLKQSAGDRCWDLL